MTSYAAVNVFRTYKQEENNFTNGLFSLLQLSRYERPRLVARFLRSLLGLTVSRPLESVRVLRNCDFADAELRCGNCCLRFETKIRSGTLTDVEVRRRLRELRACSGRLKRVVLLTPDDGKSSYIKAFLAKYQPRLLHLEWREVYDFLSESLNEGKTTTFSAIVEQFLEQIKHCIFKQDIAGVVTKIAFGDHSAVYPDEYLHDLKTDRHWNTPSLYRGLDGTGRKLLLYERNRGITAEVEIQKVKHIRWERAFPSRNVFAGRPRIFRQPIPLERIRSIPGFENFGKHRKDRSAYRNITREQYRQLLEGWDD